MKRESIAVQLEDVANQKWNGRKREKLKEYATPEMEAFLRLVYDPTIKWLLPAGEIKYRPCDDSENVMWVRLRSEVKKLTRFTSNGEYPNLRMEKRVELFRTVLETIHPKDAKMLMYVKDNKKLPFAIPFPIIKDVFSGINFGENE